MKTIKAKLICLSECKTFVWAH